MIEETVRQLSVTMATLFAGSVVTLLEKNGLVEGAVDAGAIPDSVSAQRSGRGEWESGKGRGGAVREG